MDVEVINFGCRLNLAEGEAIEAAARAAPPGNADGLIIINSCIVTAEAERQARQAVRRAARLRPDARIVVTGCGAEGARDRFAAMPEVSALVSNAAKTSVAAYSPGATAEVDRGYTPLMSGARHARAFISVQNGCDHSCTFCIIPQGRGASRSAPIASVVRACAQAVARGQHEVVLTGVDLTSYDDDGRKLGALVGAILRDVPDLQRLRLSSLDVAEIDDDLFDHLVSAPRLMPYVHLSLQAGDDLILKRMKRRHTRDEAVALVARLRAQRPDIVIGADLIAGFPTEDDAMFARTRALIADCAIMFGHIFPYSPRAGTPAARMPQVAPMMARARAAELRETCAQQRAAWLAAQVGTQGQMLVELDGETGHLENFARVVLTAPAPHCAKQVVRVNILRSDGERLYGAVL